MGHYADFAFGPLVSVLAPFHNSLVEKSTISALTTFPGTHTFNTSAFSPPFDTYPRNITAWLSPNLTIGAETFSENVIGGPAKSTSSFNPAVVQWRRTDGTIGFLTLHVNTNELTVDVREKSLGLGYAHGNSTSSFTFLVGTNSKYGKKDVAAWSDVEGIKVNVTGTVDPNYTVTFAGPDGGADDPIK